MAALVSACRGGCRRRPAARQPRRNVQLRLPGPRAAAPSRAARLPCAARTPGARDGFARKLLTIEREMPTKGTVMPRRPIVRVRRIRGDDPHAERRAALGAVTPYLG